MVLTLWVTAGGTIVTTNTDEAIMTAEFELGTGQEKEFPKVAKKYLTQQKDD